MRCGRLFVVLIGLVGCQSSAPLADPFTGYGPRVIPPPSTGTIAAPGYIPPAGTGPLAPGTASGFSAPPPFAPAPTGAAPMGTAPMGQMQPVPPAATGTLPPPQMSASPGEGNWESMARNPANDLGLMPPPGTAPVAATAPSLNWSAPTAPPPPSSRIQPATYDAPLMPPGYSSPVRPAAVRPAGHFQASGHGPADSGGCCDPTPGPLVPAAYPADVGPPSPGAVRGADWPPPSNSMTAVSRRDDRWEPRVRR